MDGELGYLKLSKACLVTCREAHSLAFVFVRMMTSKDEDRPKLNRSN
jgi:hypothetical protein